jgi:hypothetical protein
VKPERQNRTISGRAASRTPSCLRAGIL